MILIANQSELVYSWYCRILSNGYRNEWNTIQGVFGRVISNQITLWIDQSEVLLPINLVNNKMRETFWVSGWKEAFKIYGKHIWKKVIGPVNFVHVSFQFALVKLFTLVLKTFSLILIARVGLVVRFNWLVPWNA